MAQDDKTWASCPITEHGFIRIISQPSYPSPISVAHAVELLRGATGSGLHEFWSDDISLLDEERIAHSHVHGPKQLTDVYLLALAVKHGGRLVALDRSIPRSAVHGAAGKDLVIV